jgi:hypothetical protein
MRTRATAGLLLLFAALAALLAWPLLRAHATGDDFVYLALGPQLDNPLPLLVQDSTASYFFRPVVMLVWWVTSAITREPAVHYAINIGLHATNGFLMALLLRRLGISLVPAVLAAVVFVAHTTAVAAASWLSVRFDVMSLGFGLAALIALHARRPVALALLTLACVLSKETGYAIAGTAFLAALWPVRGTGRREAITMAAIIGACIAAGLAFRFLVLRSAVVATFLPAGTLATLWAGFNNWLGELTGYLVVSQGPKSVPWLWITALASLAAVLLVPSVLAALRNRDLVRTSLIGLAIAIMAGIAQGPVANVTDMRAFEYAAAFDFRPVTVSRLYYVPLAGLCIVGAALGEALARSGVRRWAKGLVVAAMVVASMGLVAQSRYVGRQVASFTRATGPVYLDAALDVVRPRTSAAPGCKIYFLDTGEKGIYFRMFLQPALLQALPREHAATRCFFLSEHAPWYNLMQAEGLPENPQRPLATMTVGGQPFPPLRLGNLVYYFLVIPDVPAVVDDPTASFFAWQDNRFVDVTEEVRARRRVVHFINNRAE